MIKLKKIGSIMVLMTSSIISFGGNENRSIDLSGEKTQPSIGTNIQRNVERQSDGQACGTPIYLSAYNMSIATGKPSLVNMAKNSTYIPVWSLSGITKGQSVAGLVAGFPRNCSAVKVEIIVTTTDKTTSPAYKDVYRAHLSQLEENVPFTSRYSLGSPVSTALPAAPFYTRIIVLESYFPIDPDAPLSVRIQREPGNPADSFTRPTGLAMVKITPLSALEKPYIVQNVKGYNSWPMLQTIGEKLVCVYSRGSGHTINEDARAVYVRTSTDNGKTWTPETVVANTPVYGEVAVGKGLDSKGAMLLWVRRIGKKWIHDLYRTADGVNFTLVTTPELPVAPVQITDIFSVPTVGLMALWFAGNYGDNGPAHSWGTLISKDDGATWKQTTIESKLTKVQWPTEPSAVYLGDGRIFAIARTEAGGAQFQMVSMDYGVTWTRAKTNIRDVLLSTPSLIFDSQTGLLCNYYYQRKHGILWRRVVNPKSVINNPLNWPASEAIAIGSRIPCDSGNVNATVIKDTHFLAFYSGKDPDTAILVSEVPAPIVDIPKR